MIDLRITGSTAESFVPDRGGYPIVEGRAGGGLDRVSVPVIPIQGTGRLAALARGGQGKCLLPKRGAFVRLRETFPPFV